jgi:hypothetical protein
MPVEPEPAWSARDAAVRHFVSEEALCDSIARGLMMPRPWVWETFRTQPVSLATVQRLAGSARVSLSSTVIRLREVLGWRDSLLHWTLHDARWLLDGEAGLFTSQRHVVEGTEALHHELGRLIGSGGWPQRQDLSLIVAGRPCTVHAEVSITAGSAVAFVFAGQLARSLDEQRRR